MLNAQDLEELSNTLLTGVTTGSGSIVLLFSNESQILIQCKFSLLVEGESRVGHGEEPGSSVVLFQELNQNVDRAILAENMVMELHFNNRDVLRIEPERNGLESYVVTTKHGICPISLPL